MKKFTLGFVCHGRTYTDMTIITLYSFYLSLTSSYGFNDIIEEIMVVTDEIDNVFIRFAKKIHKNVRVISPSNWSESGLPSYNGNYATYFKFDLLFNLPINKSMIYLDSDAFVVGEFDLNFISDRISNSRTTESILMVPSHRPAIEKIGFIGAANPFNYFNAGFMVITLSKQLTVAKLLSHRNSYYPKSYEVITMGDQDLFNSYFRDMIEPLPLRYNVSSGMLSKFNFRKGNLNYLVINEFKQAIIAHASGGILQSKKYYPYRESIARISLQGMNDIQFQKSHRLVFEQFHLLMKTSSELKTNRIRQFFGLTPECSPYLYKENIYWKRVLRILLRKLKIS